MIKSRKKRTGLWIALIVLVALLIAFRLWLPTLVLEKVNNELTKIDGYEGTVRDIDLFLIAGKYSIKDIKLDKKNGKVPLPFFKADRINLSVEWKALFKGEIVGEIEVHRPQLNYVNGPTKETTQTSIDKDWTEVVDELMPLKINRFEINEGEIHYLDFHSTPKVDIFIRNVYILATNLTNANDTQELLPATVMGSANVYEGTFSLNLFIDPLNRVPTLDMNAKLSTVALQNLNEFLRAYGNFDVKDGTLSLYMEAAAKDNRIVGYVKPIARNVEIAEWNKEEGNALQTMWESVVELAAWIFKNHPEDQLATQVEFEGNLNNPDVSVWSIVGETLRNAFIQALYPSIENSVSIGSIDTGTDSKSGGLDFSKKENKGKEEKEGFFKRLFKKKDKKNGDKSNNKKDKKN
jgi:hypothetical protein